MELSVGGFPSSDPVHLSCHIRITLGLSKNVITLFLVGNFNIKSIWSVNYQSSQVIFIT